ncbi:hypothetical protein [Xylocopilactobacillus apicola]|uniref:Uncharacterized protein n=1 Tax=Xylocopilactobacillus apicola TaxID=2932184 RepID=A0AAU9D524_9LACO|nr:hypothetical protein [Xylocopilactobacillus apicola]BDR58869.1 hypothetical protein XA3_13100 [Xylocopilactobacillus apicola]
MFDFLPHNAYTQKYDLDILKEMAGAKIAAGLVRNLIKQNLQRDFALITDLLNLLDGYLALPYVIFAQTFALLTAAKVRITADNLSLSETVKGVMIHDF